MFKYLQRHDFAQFKYSAWALIAANVLPLFGVLFLGWDTFSIVVLYWTENLIIGAINVLKMIVCNPDVNAVDWSRLSPSDETSRKLEEAERRGAPNDLRLLNHGSKLFLVPFFIFHYGLFCFVHGVFIFAIFGREEGGFGPFGGLDNVLRVFSREHLWLGVAALAASHLWSFAVNFLGKGEYRRTAVPILMFQPYARVVVLHLAILFGAFFAFALGSSIVVLMILIVGKTMVDLNLHLRERERNEGRPRGAEPILPEVIIGERQTLATPPEAGQLHPRPRSSSGG